MDKTLQMYIDKLNALNFKEMYEGDFFLTWDKTDDELEAVFTVADALRYMRENNISTKIFESGLGISLFRDNSTRTRFSFASACNLLGLEVQDPVSYTHLCSRSCLTGTACGAYASTTFVTAAPVCCSPTASR